MKKKELIEELLRKKFKNFKGGNHCVIVGCGPIHCGLDDPQPGGSCCECGCEYQGCSCDGE